MFLYEYVFNAIITLPGKESYEKIVVLREDKGINYAVRKARHNAMKEENLLYSDGKYIRIEFRSSQMIR